MSTTTTLETPRTEISHITRADNLPAATVQCHASNLLELPDKTLLCVWFGGTQEGCSDISIYLSRLAPGTSTWSPAVRVSSDPDRSEQNPVLFRDPATGTIWLLHTAQPAGNQDEAVIVARKSTDDGQKWSEPFEPFPGQRGAFIRQPIVVIPEAEDPSRNTWLLPIWYCRVPPGFRWIGSDDVSAVRYTRDGGRTWGESAVPESKGCVHMNIIAAPGSSSSLTPNGDDKYVALYRSRWADHVYHSTSRDGITWTAPTATALRNPNAGIGATALGNDDGALVLLFNDSAAAADMRRRMGLYDDITPADDVRANQPAGTDGREAIWGTPRRALTVGLSRDGGRTWRCRLLEDGDGFCMTNNSKERANRELSYPSVYADGPKGVHIAYTYHRQNIKYVHIDDVEAFVNGSS
jgi:predicted neuraminidase